MRGAGRKQGGVRGLEHQAHAGRNRCQAGDPLGAQQPGIGMRQQSGLAQDPFAHGFEIVQGRLVTQVAQGRAHFGESQFRLVAQAEEGFGAAHLFAGARDFQDLVRSHGVRAGFAGIAAEDAVAAIVAAQVGQRDEDFARIGDDAGLEALLEFQGGGEESGEFVVRATQELAGALARERQPVAQFVEISRERIFLHSHVFSVSVPERSACQMNIRMIHESDSERAAAKAGPVDVQRADATSPAGMQA